MANLFLRSPRTFQGIGTSGWNSAKLTLVIGGVTRYTLIKNRITAAPVDFEVSELIRDYLNLTYSGTINASSQSVVVSIAIAVYNGLNGTGAVNQTPTGFTFLGIDAYGYFEEGANPTTTRGYMQSNDVIYNLKDQNLRIPVDVNNSTQWNAYTNGVQFEGAAIANNTQQVFEFLDVSKNADELRITTTAGIKTIKIITIEECRYQPHKISFVNKFGAIQDLYFFKKSIDKVNTTKESFKSFNVTSGGLYDVYSHSNKEFNIISNKSITLNSGFVSEDYNAPMQELMQSELVWMEVNGIITPMNVTDTSLIFKTSANDKLVDYKLELKYANDAINNIR